MRHNFSPGREAYIRALSNIIPKNSMRVLGPTVFSSDKGTPRDEKTSLMIVMQRARGDTGKPTTRKSSRRCRTKGNLWVLYNIQHRASERVSNMRGLLRYPKVNFTAKYNLERHLMPKDARDGETSL